MVSDKPTFRDVVEVMLTTPNEDEIEEEGYF